MKLTPSLAASCSRFWGRFISPSLLFASVMVSFPAFLFQKNLMVLAAEAVAFFLLALSRRGKLKVLPSVLMVAGITFFALLSPHGEVLARLGDFAVTKGALEAGLERGVTLAGMVFLSQLALSPNVRLPGRVGGFVVEMFRLLDILAGEDLDFNKDDAERGAKKKRLGGMKGTFSALDRRLYRVYWQERRGLAGTAEKHGEKERPEANVIFSAQGVIVSVLWLAVLYGLLGCN